MPRAVASPDRLMGERPTGALPLRPVQHSEQYRAGLRLESYGRATPRDAESKSDGDTPAVNRNERLKVIHMQNVTTNSELFSDNRFHSSGQSSPGGIHILLEDKNVKNIRSFVLGLCLLTAFFVSAFAQHRLLYDSLGVPE